MTSNEIERVGLRQFAHTHTTLTKKNREEFGKSMYMGPKGSTRAPSVPKSRTGSWSEPINTHTHLDWPREKRSRGGGGGGGRGALFANWKRPLRTARRDVNQRQCTPNSLQGIYRKPPHALHHPRSRSGGAQRRQNMALLPGAGVRRRRRRRRRGFI